MIVKTLRLIDYWIGIPICLILTPLKWMLERCTFLSKTNPSPKRILFIEFVELGSAICAYPSIKYIQSRYPDAELYFWTFEANKDAIAALEIVPKENIISARTNNLTVLIWDIIKNLFTIRHHKVDTIIDCELFTRFSSILSFLTGAPIRAGFHRFERKGLYRGHLNTHKAPFNQHQHIALNFISLIKSLECSQSDYPPVKLNFDTQYFDLQLPKCSSEQEARNSVESKLREKISSIDEQTQIVILHPSISDVLPLRKWPLESYIQLTHRLLEHEDVVAVFAGTVKGRLDELFTNQLNINRTVNLIGKTTVDELIALMNISKLLISHDSGMPHIAALTKIDMIVMFGPETPLIYKPLSEKARIVNYNLSCSPCFSAFNQRASKCNNNECMKSITVDEIYALAKPILNKCSFQKNATD